MKNIKSCGGSGGCSHPWYMIYLLCVLFSMYRTNADRSKSRKAVNPTIQ